MTTSKKAQIRNDIFGHHIKLCLKKNIHKVYIAENAQNNVWKEPKVCVCSFFLFFFFESFYSNLVPNDFEDGVFFQAIYRRKLPLAHAAQAHDQKILAIQILFFFFCCPTLFPTLAMLWHFCMKYWSLLCFFSIHKYIRTFVTSFFFFFFWLD